MEKILVSACFIGAHVRYDGKHNRLANQFLTKWQQQQRLITVCPEVSGGLSIPRIAAEISNDQVIIQTGQNVTWSFKAGAHHALALCKAHNIRYALLKESSPSCGSHTIYDGSFSNTKIKGQGITTRLLQQHGIKVFSEINIDQLIAVIEKS